MLLRWRCIGKTVPFLSPTGRRSAHILCLTAILSPTLSAYRTFRCAWTFSWWIPLFDEIRTGRIHDRGSRDDGNRLSPPAACRIARRSKCSGFDDDSPWSTWMLWMRAMGLRHQRFLCAVICLVPPHQRRFWDVIPPTDEWNVLCLTIKCDCVLFCFQKVWTIAFVCGIIFHEVIESFLLDGLWWFYFNRTQSLFLYLFAFFCLTSIVTLQYKILHFWIFCWQIT